MNFPGGLRFSRSLHVVNLFIVIIIIIERRDFGGIMSNDCKNTLQTQNKTVRVRCSRTSKVSEQSIYQIQMAALFNINSADLVTDSKSSSFVDATELLNEPVALHFR